MQYKITNTVSLGQKSSCNVELIADNELEARTILNIDDDTLRFHLQEAIRKNISHRAELLAADPDEKNKKNYTVFYQIIKGIGIQ